MRLCPDDTVNKQCEMLIEFMKETKCVLNGQIPGNNNFTLILVKGRAALDYMITTEDCLYTSINLNIYIPITRITREG